MNSEQSPGALPPTPPRARGTLGPRLEMLAFAVVFAVGTVLTAFGVFGQSSTEAAPIPSSSPSSIEVSTPPTPTASLTSEPSSALPTGPPETGLPGGGLVMTTSARSDVSNTGCRADLFFTWDVDLSTAPNGDAVVQLQGPSGSKRYTLRLDGNTITLRLQVPVPEPHSEWTASLLTVGGSPVIDTPLWVSVDDPTC